MRNNLLILLFSMVFLYGCSTYHDFNSFVRKAQFLENSWESNNSGVVYTEKWIRTNNTLQGTTCIFTAKDTIFYEKNKIFFDNKGKIVFTSSIGKYVATNESVLELRHLTSHKLTFANKNQGLTYTFKHGQLIIKTWTKDNGNTIKEKYVLSKKKL